MTYYYDDKTERNETERIFSTNRRYEKFIQKFSRKNYETRPLGIYDHR